MSRPRRQSWHDVRWSLYAPIYDSFVARSGLLRRGRARAMELLNLTPGEQLLLVAAGTGLDLEFVPDGVEVTATDLTPAMVARFERRAAAGGRRVRAAVMDAGTLAFPDACFDAVALHLALAIVPDPAAAIREAARVLRPGGRLSVFDKFLADGASASRTRRLANVASWAFATSINRQLGPLLAEGGLVERTREDAGLGGMFVVAVAEKPV